MSRYSVMLISFLLIASSCHGMEPAMDEDTGLLAERKILMDALNARDFFTAQAVVDQKPEVVNAYKRCREYSLEYSGDLLTPLHECVVQDDKDAAVWLLGAGAQSNALTKMRDYAPLHCVQSVQMVKLLVAHGAHLRTQNFMGKTPLSASLDSALHDVAHCLLKQGAPVNEAIDNQGNTLLHRAVNRKNNEVIELLLQHGANPEQCNLLGQTPFSQAIDATKDNSSVSSSIITIFQRAGLFFVDLHNYDWMRDELKNNAQKFKEFDFDRQSSAVENYKENFLAKLIIVGQQKDDDCDRFKCCSDHGIIINCSGAYCKNASIHDLQVCFGEKAITQVMWHLSRRVIKACSDLSFGRFDTFKRSIECFPHIVAYSPARVFDIGEFFIKRNCKEFFLWMFDYERADVCAENNLIFEPNLSGSHKHCGNTLLHEAALSQRPWAIRVLMERNIDISQRNSAGKTAFDLLRESGNKECIDLFMDLFTQKFLNAHLYTAEYKNLKNCIKNGFDVNVPLDTFGLTLLARAVIKGCYTRCKLLLENGAWVNVQDTIEGFPLIYSVAFNAKNIDIIKLFLQHGAFVTPRMLNIVRCNYVRAMLQEAYAKQNDQQV